MVESPITVICLSLVSACMVLMTVSMLLTTRELRRTLRRLNTILPGARHALREVSHSLEQVRQFLTRINEATSHVEAVVHRACGTVSETLDRLTTLKRQAQTFLEGRLSNGAGPGPRSKHRGR